MKNKKRSIINNEKLHSSSNTIVKNGDLISLMTWNLGYAGLGKESSFFYDALGKGRLFPPSKKIVEKNLEGIINILNNNKDINVILLQEVTTSSIMNYNVKMYDKLSLLNYNMTYSPTLKINFPIKLHQGNLTLTNYSIEEVNYNYLPYESKGLSSLLKQKYNFIVHRYNIKNSKNKWVIVNLQLAAFDKNGDTRKEQLAVINNFIVKEYQNGNYVVVGGDWNMRLTNTSFAYNTEAKYLFWIYDLPNIEMEDLSDWKWGIDKDIPTVRTNEKPYIINNNYTTIIDGFLCSPNVEIVQVKGINTQFEYSDHNPVIITVRTKKINRL